MERFLGDVIVLFCDDWSDLGVVYCWLDVCGGGDYVRVGFGGRIVVRGEVREVRRGRARG